MALAQALLEHCTRPSNLPQSAGGAGALTILAEQGPSYQRPLELGVNVPSGGDHGSALGFAAAHGRMEIVQLLLEHAADVSLPGGRFGSPLGSAIAFGQRRVVQLLLEKGADVSLIGGSSESPLGFAVKYDRSRIVGMLLDHGADVNLLGGYWGSPLGEALARRNSAMGFKLICAGADVNYRGGFYGSALGIVAATKNAHCAHLLLINGADVNFREGDYGSPLWMAAVNGNMALVELLLNRGALVNCWSSVGPLHAATQHLHEGLVARLLGMGADLNPLDEGDRTPLYLVAEGNSFRCINERGAQEARVAIARRLLDAGADVNAVRPRYGNVLTKACEQKQTGLVNLLIAHGVDLHLRDAMGRTAIEVAREYEATTIVEILTEAIQCSFAWPIS